MNARCNSHPIRPPACAALSAALLLTAAQPAAAQPGWVLSHQKISDTQGGFTGRLDNIDWFGKAVASLGDLDGDGVSDLVVGARNDDDGGVDRGAVWVLFLNTDGTVKSHQKISSTRGGFTGPLRNSDLFGNSAAALGDLDGDGVPDLAVGAPGDADGGGFGRGAVWVLFLNRDGTVKSHQKISDTQGGFTGTLDNEDLFGWSLAALGDLDRDGASDLAVGAWFDDDGGTDRGAVWVLFLNTDGTVKSHRKISDTRGNFTGILENNDHFGFSVGSLGDLDRDGAGDLAVGAINDDDGGNDRGAVWVLFLNTDGTVKSHQKISSTRGGFTGPLNNGDHFGSSAASLGDLDGDGASDLAVGAEWDDDGGSNRGAVWILFLNTDGRVKSHQKISFTEGGFTGILDDGDLFGISAVSLGDLDGDGVTDLAVGAADDDDGGENRGAVWVLFLDGVAAPSPGDLNCDGVFNGGDIDPFFLALGDPAAYTLAFPNCDILLGDMNCDQTLNGGDIDPFFDCLAGNNCGEIAINQQPQGQDLCVGNTLTLSVEASGINLTFQWRKDGTPIAGATQRTYRINAVTLQDAGTYEVLITNPCDFSVSNPATISVSDLIFTHPVSQTVCENDPVLFSVTAVGQALTYQWRKDGVAIPGATSSLFIIPAAQPSDGGVYDVVVTSSQCAQISAPATLTVQQCP